MQAKLQRVEVESIVPDDDNLAIEHAAGRQSRADRLQQLGKVAVERLFVATLDQDLISVTKHQGAKTVPFGFENPISAVRQFTYPFGEHGQERRIDRKVHASWYIGVFWEGECCLQIAMIAQEKPLALSL